LAGILNALKLVKKDIKDIKVVVNGGGAAGTSITRHIMNAGAKNVIVCDMNGAIVENDPKTFVSSHHEQLAKETNPNKESGKLVEIMKNADVFVGVSKGGLVNEEMIKSMNSDSIVFAMANPVPEIMPELAKKAGARVVGSGRSDFPNQINNLLAFPGIFRGALDSRAKDITEEMKLAASYAIAGIIDEKDLREDYVMPSPFNKEIAIKVADAVKKVAKKNS